jgi:hypothetical protein
MPRRTANTNRPTGSTHKNIDVLSPSQENKSGPKRLWPHRFARNLQTAFDYIVAEITAGVTPDRQSLEFVTRAMRRICRAGAIDMGSLGLRAPVRRRGRPSGFSADTAQEIYDEWRLVSRNQGKRGIDRSVAIDLALERLEFPVTKTMRALADKTIERLHRERHEEVRVRTQRGGHQKVAMALSMSPAERRKAKIAERRGVALARFATGKSKSVIARELGISRRSVDRLLDKS